MKIMESALKAILTTRRITNAQWWHGYPPGTLELNTTKTGLPLSKLTGATMQFCVGVDTFLREDQLCPRGSFKYAIRRLHRSGVRNIKFEFDRGM